MPHILIIDDDTELCRLLKEYIEKAGFSCSCAYRAETGLASVSQHHWDLLVLDIMLPGKTGLELLAHIRATGSTRKLPVLILSARDEETDKVVGLEMGADDYLAKPFSARELLARIRALLRRIEPEEGGVRLRQIRQYGDLHINPCAFQVVVSGRNIEVSAVELRLLEAMLETAGAVVARDALYQIILGHLPHPFDRRLDTAVSRLRKKLGPREDGGDRIKAVRGEGYVYLLPEGAL
jgi:two-component system response regulator CpxR